MQEYLRNIYKMADSGALARTAFLLWSEKVEASGIHSLQQMAKSIAVAVKRQADRWIAEIRIPMAVLFSGMKDPMNRPWGANFCRSIQEPPSVVDHFSCWSRVLRGRFAQPNLFGHIRFDKEDAAL